MLRTSAPFLAAALVLGAQEPAPSPSGTAPRVTGNDESDAGMQDVIPASQAGPALAGGPLYSMTVFQQDVEAVLQEFARHTSMPMSIPDLPTQLITLSFQDLPFDRALAQITGAGRLEYRVVDGVYVVGMPIDMRLRYPAPDEKVLDATYRCRRISADSLANAIRNVLPELKITTGALFLSPTLENSGNSGGGEQVRTLRSTDVAFRTHDVLFSGPPDLVRRALFIAQKFDRPRKEVRINIRVVAINKNAADNLGIDWMNEVTYQANERSDPNASGSLASGIRLGKFDHTPLVLNATLNALEQRGRSKTLTNPTVTLLDGERSFILNGQRHLYPRYTGKDQNGQSIYDVAEAKIGVYLQVGVQVGLDNDMVLSLYPQVSSLGTPTEVNGAEYPTINTAEEQTTVRATSGETLVLGGMFQDATQLSQTGLPFLSRLPLLGRLFSNRSSSDSKQELMIILTPELVEETVPKAAIRIDVKTPPA